MPDRTILYVIGSLDLGGAERHIASIAPQLKNLGWRPTVYCLAARGQQADDLERTGVRVIGPPFSTGKSKSKIGSLLRLLGSTAKLFMRLLSAPPDIIHFFLPAAYIIGAPLAIVARVRVRLMSRRSLNRYQRNYPVLRRVERRLHRHMHMLLGNSKAVVEELKAEAGSATPVGLIYNGVDTGNYLRASSAARNEEISNEDALTMIIVANLIAYKGHADLFEALALKAGTLPKSWRLLCVGRDDGLAERLQALAQTSKIDSHVHLLGARTDIAALLAGADIGILCSHEEGFSNAVLEGMAAGLPMVVTDVGGNAEAVIDGETGIVVPAHDPKALGAAIERLAHDRDLRRRMGAAARQRVETRFSMEACVSNYDALYRRLLRIDGPLPAVDGPVRT